MQVAVSQRSHVCTGSSRRGLFPEHISKHIAFTWKGPDIVCLLMAVAKSLILSAWETCIMSGLKVDIYCREHQWEEDISWILHSLCYDNVIKTGYCSVLPSIAMTSSSWMTSSEPQTTKQSVSTLSPIWKMRSPGAQCVVWNSTARERKQPSLARRKAGWSLNTCLLRCTQMSARMSLGQRERTWERFDSK